MEVIVNAKFDNTDDNMDECMVGGTRITKRLVCLSIRG